MYNQPPKANSAFHPFGVGKWVLSSAGKAKACMVHSISGCMQGVQVKLWHHLRTCAIPECLRGVIMTRRYTNPRLHYWSVVLWRTGTVKLVVRYTPKLLEEMEQRFDRQRTARRRQQSQWYWPWQLCIITIIINHYVHHHHQYHRQSSRTRYLTGRGLPGDVNRASDYLSWQLFIIPSSSSSSSYSSSSPAPLSRTRYLTCRGWPDDISRASDHRLPPLFLSPSLPSLLSSSQLSFTVTEHDELLFRTLL